MRESHISFLDLSTYDLAYQLTVRDYSIFRNVLPTDYVTDLFHRLSGPKDPSEIKAMKELEALVNDEMFWVIHEGKFHNFIFSRHFSVSRELF